MYDPGHHSTGDLGKVLSTPRPAPCRAGKRRAVA